MAQSTYSVSVSGGSYISVPLPSIAPGDDFVLSFWVWRSSADLNNYQTLFDDDTTTRRWATFVSATGLMSFPGLLYLDAPAWSADTWHHFALRVISGIAKTYLDGAEVGSPYSIGSLIPALALHFGDNPSSGGTNFTGGYDDIAFWQTSVPSTGDIAGIADGSVDAATLSPLRLWRLEAGTGTVAADSGGGSHDGSLTGTWSSDVPTPLAGGGGGGVSLPALDQGMLIGGLATLCGGLA